MTCETITWPGVAALLLAVLFFGWLAYLMAHLDD